MTLAELLRDVPVLDVRGSLDRSVHHVTRDSREVRPDSVFAAVVGATVDGHDYASMLDCAAVLVERDVSVKPGVTVVLVRSTKRALALLASAIHGNPSQDVSVIGVTGTNGKTTVTTMVEGALLHLGHTVARVGTTGNAVNGVSRPSGFTTPEAPVLHSLLAELRDEGVKTLVMEVSSIGLSQHRVDGIAFRVAAFTNLTQDHLDFHGTMEAYESAKARLFQDLLGPKRQGPRAILWGDDPAQSRMGAPSDRWTYGESERCDVRLRSSERSLTGMVLQLETPRGSTQLRSPMIGAHNALNLTGAMAILLAHGVELDDARLGLEAVAGVPGRLEVVSNPGQPLVVVDYAHSEDALQHALSTLRALNPRTLWVVFGCGGDRDRSKRSKMGAAAHALADHVVVTNDNPRGEDPDVILDHILAGIPGNATRLADRKTAIGWALQHAQPGDAVLIAGK
ncbi:MAG: UDP-N-acetylmuramoyl-L-alanyl-D-glutamate--2,6-diaminopimelate ligase [Rhodobacterales bacterium]|nr:UDP-N-acetylmuramoyl-L-alanyl-D-glutamate--2,6-diaminopimelate ligase [Rhodobacterales bacterium]